MNATNTERIDALAQEIDRLTTELQQEREAREALQNELTECRAEIKRNKKLLEKVDTERIEELEETQDEHSERIEEAEETAEQSVSSSREIAASVNAMKNESESDEPEQAAGKATSPMDFFINCQQYHVNQTLSNNRARAVEIVRRRDEFSREGSYRGSRIFEKDDVKEALTAIQGKRPHRETVRRVWDYISDMGGKDVYEATVQVGTTRSGSRKEVIRVSPDADERFNEGRYVGMNLLSHTNGPDAARSVLSGGVTPVVTGETA